MKIETYKSEKWIEFKEKYGISKKIELVDVANAFYAGYGEGYAKSSEDSYSESEKASMILSLREQIEKLQESNRILKEALEYYANGNGGDENEDSSFMSATLDFPFSGTQLGKRAREALKNAEEV